LLSQLIPFNSNIPLSKTPDADALNFIHIFDKTEYKNYNEFNEACTKCGIVDQNYDITQRFEHIPIKSDNPSTVELMKFIHSIHIESIAACID
jgi:hypothetical protein